MMVNNEFCVEKIMLISILLVGSLSKYLFKLKYDWVSFINNLIRVKISIKIFTWT